MQDQKVCRYDRVNGIAVLTVDAPPVNALSARVRLALEAALNRAKNDREVQAVVILCAGRTFFAGADISEIGKPLVQPGIRGLAAIIENADLPIITGIHGAALGGGLELALAAHCRVAVASARLGLPEVALGLLPGAGGTQRLPRIIGVERALEMVAGGLSLSAEQAAGIGLVDVIAPEGRLRETALSAAAEWLKTNRPLIRVRDRMDKIESVRADPMVFTKFRKNNADRFQGFIAPEYNIQAIEAATCLSFEEGMEREQRLFAELQSHVQSKALRYIFFAERQAAKVYAGVPDAHDTEMGRIALLGKGPACDLLARDLRDAGRIVTVVDTAADIGVTATFDLLLLLNDRDTMEARAFISKIRAVGAGTVVADCDLATNISALANDTDMTQTICLTFYPAQSGKSLVEIAKTDTTLLSVVARFANLVKAMGRTSVVSTVRCGTIGSRLIAARDDGLREVAAMGADVDTLRRLTDFDFGCDVSLLQAPAFAADVADDWHAGSWMLCRLAERGKALLEQDIAANEADIDVVAVLGLGWPRYLGGPMFWAEQQGWAAIADRLDVHAPPFMSSHSFRERDIVGSANDGTALERE